MAARILCLLVLAMELRALWLSIGELSRKTLTFYTQLSNLVTLLSAIPVVIFGAAPFLAPLRYLSSCMLTMTFFVTVCILVPMGGDPKKLLLRGRGLYVHLLVPILSTGSYLLAEAHVRKLAWLLLPTLGTLIYGLLMLLLNHRGMVDGPYPFFRVRQQTAAATVLWTAALAVAIALISLLILVLSR